jgi:uncharacterized protein involved in outer membrane biogenesis
MQVALPGLRDRRIRRLLAVLGSLLLAVIVLALVFDPNWLKGPIERRVEAATGRLFRIHGDLRLDLGRLVRVSADRVELANANWARAKHLAVADRIALAIDPWPLFKGELRLAQIELDRPQLDLERNAQGDANWSFERARTPARRHVRFDELLVRDGVIRLREPRLDTDLELKVRTGTRARGEVHAPLLAKGHGRYRRGNFELEARADSPLQLLRKGAAYRLQAHVSAGDTHARLSGALPSPIDLRSFRMRAEIAGPDLADLYTLLGFATPGSPPYALSGTLVRDGTTVSYRDFSGKIGDTDIAGNLSVDLARDPPFARAQLVSKHLDLDDLAVLIGAPPATGPGETANSAQRAEATERAASSKLLPDRPFNLTKLRVMDADVTLHATKVESKKFAIDSLDARVQLDGGVLSVRPLAVGLAGGKVEGGVRLDARQSTIATSAELQARDVELPRLFPRLRQTSVGRIGGTVDLTGHGNSVAAMLASADGEIATGMGEGRMSNLLLELAGLDVAESIKFLLGKDKSVAVRCAYADFAVADGVMQSRAMAMDTSDTVITGKGSLDLRDESLDLTLRPRPRDVSPIALRVPLEVAGTFKDPSFHPQAGPLAIRAAAAGALYAIAPPAALLALIETGPGGKVNCGPDAATADEDAKHDDRPSSDKGKEEAKTKTERAAERAYKSPTRIG